MKHIQVKPTDETLLKIYPRKYVSSPDIEAYRERPYNEVVFKKIAQSMTDKCTRVCRPWSYWTCTDDKDILEIPMCNNENERECFSKAMELAEKETLPKPCTKFEYKVVNNLFTKGDGPNVVKVGIKFTDKPPTVKVKEEYLIYDMISMISAIDGTLGLCIGLSFKDIYWNMLALFQLGEG